MATLSPASSPSVSSSHAAEALLHRARRLSHNANERSSPSRPFIPTAFAEGEQLILPSSSSSSHLRHSSSPSTSISITSKLPSPSLSPTSCLTTADLHQKHRESFNGIIREHGRKRSSVQRHSSASSSSSSSTSTSPTRTTSPASPLSDPSPYPVTMVITSSVSSSAVSKEQRQEQQQGDPEAQKQGQEQDQQEKAEGRRQLEQSQPCLTSPSVALSSSSTDDASVDTTNTTANSISGAQTSTPSPSPSSPLCPTITQTTTETTATDPSLTRRSLTIVTRPRALTLESIRELRESSSDHNPHSPSATSTTSTLAPMDHHRKHRSDLGNHATIGLVRGVMEALRDNEQSQHSRARSTPGWALSLPEAAATTRTPTPTPTAAFSQQRDLGQDVRMQDHGFSAVDNKATTPTSSSWMSPSSSLSEQQNLASPIHPATPTSTSIHSIHPIQVPLNSTNANTPAIPEAIDTAFSDLSMTSSPLQPPQKSALDRSFTATSSPPTSSPLRRSSMTPSSHSHSSDTTNDETISNSNKGAAVLSSSPPVAAGVAAVTASSTKARRSSKLFGKLVPKFLQTSFGPNNPSGGSKSPRSAVPTSPSPLSAMARPTRSASFTGSTTAPSSFAAAIVAGGGASGAVGGGALAKLPELPSLSNSVLSSNEDWLGLHNGANKDRKAPSPVLLPASPIATVTTVESAHEQPIVTSQFNMSIIAIEEKEESLHSSHSSTYEFRTYNEQLEQERPLSVLPQDDGFSFHKQEHPASFSNHNQYMQVEEDGDYHKDHDDDDSGSPYIIDENCDDDFFLNSVLRKKSSSSPHGDSNTSPTSSPSTRPYPPPLLSTGSWRGSSSGTTPSLSAASGSSSSQASSMAPSPTSPYNPSSSSMYTPAPTPVSATPFPYRSNSITNGGNGTTTQMIQPGLDEKRSRLRDAVGEWRRSANASVNSSSAASDMESTPSPVASTSYSGFL